MSLIEMFQQETKQEIIKQSTYLFIFVLLQAITVLLISINELSINQLPLK
jgi:hypothetical protein